MRFLSQVLGNGKRGARDALYFKYNYLISNDISEQKKIRTITKCQQIPIFEGTASSIFEALHFRKAAR